MHPLLQVFLEAVAGAQIVPLRSPSMFFAMRGFGEPGLVAAAFAGAAGAAAGSMITWGLGWMLAYARNREQLYVSDSLYGRLRKLGNTWLLPLLLFTWIDFAALLVMVFSFLQVPLRKTLPLVAAGWLGYYLYWAFMPA